MGDDDDGAHPADGLRGVGAQQEHLVLVWLQHAEEARPRRETRRVVSGRSTCCLARSRHVWIAGQCAIEDCSNEGAPLLRCIAAADVDAAVADATDGLPRPPHQSANFEARPMKEPCSTSSCSATYRARRRAGVVLAATSMVGTRPLKGTCMSSSGLAESSQRCSMRSSMQNGMKQQFVAPRLLVGSLTSENMKMGS